VLLPPNPLPLDVQHALLGCRRFIFSCLSKSELRPVAGQSSNSGDWMLMFKTSSQVQQFVGNRFETSLKLSLTSFRTGFEVIASRVQFNGWVAGSMEPDSFRTGFELIGSKVQFNGWVPSWSLKVEVKLKAAGGCKLKGERSIRWALQAFSLPSPTCRDNDTQ